MEVAGAVTTFLPLIAFERDKPWAVVKVVSAPGNGNPAYFTISGTGISAFVNDVYIYTGCGATSNESSPNVWAWVQPTCTVTTLKRDIGIIVGMFRSLFRPQHAASFALQNGAP